MLLHVVCLSHVLSILEQHKKGLAKETVETRLCEGLARVMQQFCKSSAQAVGPPPHTR